MATSIVAARPRATHPKHRAVARHLARSVKGVDGHLAEVIVGKWLEWNAAGAMTREQALVRFAARVGIDPAEIKRCDD